MRPVPREEVIHAWLQQDLEKHRDSWDFEIEELDESEKAAKLLELNPDAASPFLKHGFDWYKTTLSEQEFRQLYSVWQNLGVPDHTIAKLGEDLKKEESEISEAISRSKVDEERISEIAKSYPRDHPKSPLIITSVVTGKPRVADGNHRATGLALHMAKNRDYQPQEAYIGFTAPPKVQDLFKKVRIEYFQKLNRFW